MAISTIIGIVGGAACVIIGILLGGPLSDFWDAQSVFITVGGTFCALIASYPMSQVKETLGSVRVAFKQRNFDANACIQQIIDLASIARRDGLLALENMLEDIESPFLKKGIMLIVDGSNSELVKSVMETEIYYISDRHDRCANVLSQGAAYAPSFGMAGTLIGLIQMLLKMDDASSLGPAMSVALITTFYGVLLANLFFTPLSKKLKTESAYEQSINEMMLEGILSIQDGENPRAIRSKLDSFISHSQAAELDKKLKGPEKVEEEG